MRNVIRLVAFGLTLFALLPLTVVKGATRARRASEFMCAPTQKGKISDPAVAARRLYNAWRQRNRKAALQVAEPKAVNKLFGVRRVAMKFKGCELHDEVFYCVYHNARLDLDMSIEVSGGASAGYHVRWVTFSSEH